MDNWLLYGWPVAALIMACVVFGTLWMQSRSFDRDFGAKDRAPPAGE